MPTGQVSHSYAGRGVFKLNLEVAEPLLEQLENKRLNDWEQHPENALSAARRLSGYREPTAPGEPVYRGPYQRDGYSIEMYVRSIEQEVPLPLLVFVPEAGGPFRSRARNPGLREEKGPG